jgi:predicted CXXCH cytochrome family protein
MKPDFADKAALSSWSAQTKRMPLRYKESIVNPCIAAVIVLFCGLLLAISPAEAGKKHRHQPFADGSCKSCHTSDKPDGADLSAQPPGLCYGCHEQFSGKFEHSPSSIGACLFCHNPHESDNGHLLNQPTAALCFQCHDQLEKVIGDKQNSIHPPAQDDCTACHNPHASNISAKLLQKEMRLLCIDCHSREGVAQPADFDRVATKHKPIDSKESCGNCHNPHGSPYAAYLAAPSMDLCLRCHSDDIRQNDGKFLPGLAKLLKENPDHHGPIKEKNCTGCHNPHGSNFYRMLQAEYPAGFYIEGYTRDKFTLCFTCHDPAAMEAKETTSLTNFRNGKQNLHFLHVNRDTKGRSCRACHATHASKEQKHIREAVPFGKADWPLRLQYKIEYSNPVTGETCTTPSKSCVPSGGSCVACHVRMTYNYLPPHKGG